MKTCAICGESLLGLDGRYKYCSDECAEDGHRRLCRENFRRRYREHHAQELARKKIARHKAQGE